MSDHVVIAPEGDVEQRRHAHLECVRAARESGTFRTYDDWQATQAAEIDATDLAPTDELESSILFTMPVGDAAYTAIVRGANNTTGVGLVEAYFGDPCLGTSCP